MWSRKHQNLLPKSKNAYSVYSCWRCLFCTCPVIIVGVAKDKIVVAADSRESTDAGVYGDKGCKITALNDKLIFGAAGLTKFLPIGGIVGWDVVRDARAALADIKIRDRDNPGDFMGRVASNFGARARTNISKSFPRNLIPGLVDNKVLVGGYFIGSDEVGNLTIFEVFVREKIKDGSRGFGFTTTKIVASKEAIYFTNIGESDVFDEFVAGKSQRSLVWRQQIRTYARQHGIADIDMAEAMMLVDLTGSYGQEKVSDRSTVQLVGGPTDAIELRRGKGVQWVQRKPNCPQQ